MVRVLACVGLVAAAGLAGCSGLVPNHKDVAPVVGPAPRLNSTPMAPALACLRAQVRKSRRDLRIGVNDFVDGTGVMEGGTQYSHALTQRPDMMMVVALASAGAHLVNRSSVNVAEWELKQAMDKKLGDGRKEVVEGQPVTFRPIRTGVILGSTDYVSGAITELNWNIASGVAEAGAYSAAIGKRTYRISLAIDLMVTNTQTTEIVYAKSFKKQLVGFETNANFFRFVNQDSALQIVSLGNAAASTATQALELFNANLGEKQNEPTQVALRWVVDLAAYDIMRKLTRTGQSCDTLLPQEKVDDDANVTIAANAGAAPPENRVADTAAKAAAPKPETPIARQPKAASIEAPAPEKPIVEAHAQMSAPQAAEAKPSTPKEKLALAKPSAATAKGVETRRPAAAAELAVATPPAAAEKRAAAKRPAATEKLAMAKPSTATEKRVKAKPSAATEKSSANAQPQAKAKAQSSDDGSGIHWMSGAVPALRPEWSRVGQAGDGQ